MKKREFIKELRKEKNEIFKNRRILYILPVLAIVYLISTYYILFDQSPVKISMSLYWIQWALYAIAIIPACIVDIDTDSKINKMFEEYKKGNKDCRNSQKPISRLMIILALIVGVIGLIELSDFSYSIITGNPPKISLEEHVENQRYSEKYKTLFYDYYKCDDGEVYLRLKKEGFRKGYAEKVSVEEYIKKFNNNLKLSNIDKSLKFDEKLYNYEKCYTWIIEKGKFELEIILDDIENEMKDENSLGNVKWVDLICFDENYDKNKFEEYSKVLIKTDADWYTEEQIEKIYNNAIKFEYEEDGIDYELEQYDNYKSFSSYRFFEDYYNM